MQGCINFTLSIVVALVIPLLLSLRNQRGGTETEVTHVGAPTTSPPSSCSGSSFSMNLVINETFFFNQRIRHGSSLEYDLNIMSHRSTSTVIRICCDHREVSPALFHHCFTEGCNASLLLGENGDRNRSVEEVEQAGPGTVSCADMLALVARNPVILDGGPVYPVLIGKRDSNQSFIEEALTTVENPRNDDMDNTTCTLHLYNLRRANERETVGLVEIGKTGCDFILQEPHPSIITIHSASSMHNMKNNNICSDKVVAPLVISKPKLLKLNDIASWLIGFLFHFVIDFLYAL